MKTAFDVVVIGGGPAGYKAAIGAARRGAAVALIEAGRLGGTCLNEGCIPSHALLYPASLLDDVRGFRERGLEGDLRGDFAAAARHKAGVVDTLRSGIVPTFRRLGITLFEGRGRFETSRRVRVTAVSGESSITAPRVIVAAGSRPRALPGCPVDGTTVIGSREFYTRLESLPDRMLIVGGGPVGVETAFIAHQFGVRVTLIERADRLLPGARVPEHAADLLEARLRARGVDVRTGIELRGSVRTAGGVAVQLSDGSALDVPMVLVAVGREPASETLGLENAGIATASTGHVLTDECLETTAKGVFATGDVRDDGPMTANAALYDAKIAVANALGGTRERANYFKVPFVVHSALEIATVGLDEARADAAGFEPEVARTSFGASGKARARRDTDGFIEVVHDVQTGQLLGGCIVGPEAGEQILVLAAACQSPRGLWLLNDLAYSHPSWCEEIEAAVDPATATLSRSAAALFMPGIHARA